MSWRTVIITNRCKLDYSMGFLVVRGGEETKKVFLDEIAILVIENTAVSITGCLIAALVDKKIKVVICDEKRSPLAELTPYYGSYDCSSKVKTQASWQDDVKGAVWVEIVSEKIRKQAEFLKELQKKREVKLLESYLKEVDFNDATNREGHAAKVYFNALFGMSFSREEDNPINSALNYGYSIILSAFNREITACGYMTQFGLFHSNVFNFFNLSCDLMEPYRILVDREVVKNVVKDFTQEEKHKLWGLLNKSVEIDNQKQTVLNAIRIYTRSIFDAINNNNTAAIKHYKDI